jgi:hypothetical protein
MGLSRSCESDSRKIYPNISRFLRLEAVLVFSHEFDTGPDPQQAQSTPQS